MKKGFLSLILVCSVVISFIVIIPAPSKAYSGALQWKYLL